MRPIFMMNEVVPKWMIWISQEILGIALPVLDSSIDLVISNL